MVHIKKKIVIFMILLLSACSITNDIEAGNDIIDEESPWNMPMVDAEVIAELLDSDPVPHWIVMNRQYLLMDLISGEILSEFEVDEGGFILGAWNLDNGYVFQKGHPRDQESRLIILDDMFNYIETLEYNEDESLMLFSSVLRFSDDELIVYGPRWNEYWDTDPLTDFLRFNVHTGEIEELFKIEGSMRLYDFIGDNQIFISNQNTDWEAAFVYRDYGILSLDTGEIALFESDNFAYGDVFFQDTKVLLSEAHPQQNQAYQNEILILNTQDMSSTFIQVKNGDGISAHFSFDGQHIVTINEEASVFRKYNLNGEIIVEIKIELPIDIEGIDEFSEEELADAIFSRTFEIFAITDQIYAVHTRISIYSHWFSLRDYYIQHITFP